MPERLRLMLTAGILVGIFFAALDQTIISTALPVIVADLGGMHLFAWVQTAAQLTATMVVPLVGKLSDLYGRRRFYLAGMAVFMLGSALAGSSQTILQLIAYKAVQGLGSGMLMTMGFTIVGDLYPGAQRAKVQGFFAGMWGLASVVGPQVGGFIVDNLSWRWIFYVYLPLGALAAAAIAAWLQESRLPGRKQIDWLGAAALTPGIAIFLLSLSYGGRSGAWGSPAVVMGLGSSLLLFALFIYVETRAEEPLLPLRFFKVPVFAAATSVVFLTTAGLFGAIFFVSLYMQAVVGVSPTLAGSATVPMTAMMVVGSFTGGRTVVRLGYRRQVTIGLLLSLTGFFFLTRLGVDATYLQVVLSTLLCGLGLGLTNPTLTIAVQTHFPTHQRGTVTAATQFARSMGSAVGLTIWGVLLNAQMARVFQVKVAPLLQGAPQAIIDLAQRPQELVQLTLKAERLAAVPEALRPALVQGVKEMLAQGVHTIFVWAMGVLVLALLCGQILGEARLETRAAPPQSAPAHDD